MIKVIKPVFAPQVRSINEVPMAVLQVAVFGAVGGPLIGLVFGWLFLPAVAQPTQWVPFTLTHWLVFGARGGMTYALVFYSVFGLGLRYVRLRFQPSGTALWLLSFAGWFLALLLLTVLLPFGEWFGEAVRARSIRILLITTLIFILLGVFRAALGRANAERVAAEARAQVKALQAQIHRHFFFNTLNAIYALIPVDPPAAQRTVGLLADMSRHAFASAQSDLIPLVQELDFANAYLEIERVRFGARLKCDMPAPTTAAGIHVPALSLQPLIENAIRHGIMRRLDGGQVSVALERNQEGFSLVVTNDCQASNERTARAFFREGHALENIRERFHLHFWRSSIN